MKSVRDVIMSNNVYYRCQGGVEAKESDYNRHLTDDETIEEINYTISVNERWICELPDDDDERLILKKENIALKKLLSKCK